MAVTSDTYDHHLKVPPLVRSVEVELFPLEMKIFATIFVALLATAFSSRCPNYVFTVVHKTSSNSQGLKSAVNTFTNRLGGKDNGDALGPLSKGQRSVRISTIF